MNRWLLEDLAAAMSLKYCFSVLCVITGKKAFLYTHSVARAGSVYAQHTNSIPTSGVIMVSPCATFLIDHAALRMVLRSSSSGSACASAHTAAKVSSPRIDRAVASACATAA